MTKISSLTALAGASVDTAADLLPIVDMSLSGASRNKKILASELKTALLTGATAIAGNTTVTGTLGVSSALTVTAGGATVTAGGLTVAAGGATVTGNSTVTGTLGVSGALTVSSGGATVTGNSTVTGTLTATSFTATNGWPYDLFVFYPGVLANSAVLLRHVAVRAWSLPTNASGSALSAGTAATGSTTLTLKKNGSSIGTAVVSASGTTAAFTVTATSFAATDVLTVEGPGTADATLANVALSLLGTR